MDSEADLEERDDDASSASSISPVEIFGFVVRAARRHVLFGTSVAVFVGAMGLGFAQIVPQSYDAMSRVFIDETMTKTEALSSPDRALPNLDPVSGAYELLTQKSSLLSMIDETELLANWEATRSAPFRFKDQVMTWLRGSEVSLRDKREGLAKVLEKRLYLSKDGNIVTVRVVWRTPEAAFSLTKAAQRRLIDLVRTRQVSAFTGAITILEEEAKRAREAIDPALEELIRVRDLVNAKKGRPTTAGASSVALTHVSSRAKGASGGSSVSSERNDVDSSVLRGQQLSAKLAELGNRIQAVEDPWHRRQLELSSRMTELSAVYGKEHPQILQLQTQIKAASSPPAELIDLRKMRADLLNEVQGLSANRSKDSAAGATKGSRLGGAIRSVGGLVRMPGLNPLEPQDDDPTVIAAKAGLNRTIEEYDRLNTRLSSARLQAAAAEVSFNRRFVITAEPELAKAPMRPLRLILSISSVVAALLLGLVVGALRDILSGTVHEPWQIRQLGLKTIGELPVPKRLEP